MIQLYDLEDDPGESTDIAATIRVSPKVTEIMKDARVENLDYPFTLKHTPGNDLLGANAYQ